MLRSSLLILLLLLVSGVTSDSAAAQPDRTMEELEQAKKKFESDISKLDEALIANIDKALLGAKKDKKLEDKLTYERPLFVTQHLIPTEKAIAGSTNSYLANRAKATKTLIEVYEPKIKSLKKSLKFDEAGALEDSLSEILKSARGYGLPFPDLEAKRGAMYWIENKSTGTVIDLTNERGWPQLVLRPKDRAGKNPSQCWVLEREEKGIMIRNVKNNQAIESRFADANPGIIMSTVPVPMNVEHHLNWLFRVEDFRGEFILKHALNDLLLTATIQKVKGESFTYVTKEPLANSPQQPNQKRPPDTQLWSLMEAK